MKIEEVYKFVSDHRSKCYSGSERPVYVELSTLKNDRINREVSVVLTVRTQGLPASNKVGTTTQYNPLFRLL